MPQTPSADPASTDPPARSARLAAFLLLFLLPFAVRAIGTQHGHGEGYVPDTHVVRNALGMARDRNPVPPVGQYSTYPNLLPYLLLPLYATYYVQGSVTGEWEGAEDFGSQVQLEPGDVHRIARLLVALLATLSPWVVWRIVRGLGAPRGAWIAGALVATCLLQTQFATQERPWAPMSSFFALAAWGAIVHVQRGGRKPLLLSAIAAALAFATHQAGLGALGLTGLGWLFGPLPWTGAGLAKRVREGFVAVLLFTVVGVLLGHPYLLVHGRTATEAVVGGDEVEKVGGLSIGGMTIVLDLRWETAKRLVPVLLGYDPVLLLLGLAGLVTSFWRRALAPVTIFVCGWSFFFLTNPSDHVRYLLPSLVLLAVPAGLLAERLWSAKAARVCLVVALALPTVQCLRFVQLISRPDTRALVEEEFYDLPLGARVGIDRYGPTLDGSIEALTLLKELRSEQGGGLYSRERHRRKLLSEGRLGWDDEGFDILPLEDLFEFDEREGTVEVREGLLPRASDPATLLASLGVTHVLLVDRRTETANLLAPMVEGRDPLWELDPGGDEPAPEAFLPLEMDCALTALWSVERPGPRLRLFALN